MKNLIVYIPIITLSVTLIAGWVKLNAQSESNREEIKVIKTEIKEIATEGDKKITEIKDDNKELEKKVEVNKNQQDNIQKEVQQINTKTDKIYELLIQMQPKKK